MNISNSELTMQILHSISNRLSSRHDCRKIEYTITIYSTHVQPDVEGCTDSYIQILFQPDRDVYPDRFHRTIGDKIDIVTYTLHTYFPEIIKGHDTFGRPYMSSDSLIPGTYRYVLSFDKKQRRWIRDR